MPACPVAVTYVTAQPEAFTRVSVEPIAPTCTTAVPKICPPPISE